MDISKGVALLDSKRPGWENEIDLERLRMEMPCDCVVGQLYGHYGDGLEELGVDVGFDTYGLVEPTEVELGFLLDLRMEGNWRDLAEAWQNEILARRAAQ